MGLSLFIASNLLCAMANSSLILLLARFMAGVGAGAGGVLNRAIAGDCFKGAEFSKAWSYTTSTLVITLCIAPVLGGYVQQFMGWRANFYLSTFYIAVVLVVVLGWLPETRLPDKSPATGKPGLTIRQIVKNYHGILKVPSFLTGTLCYTLSFSGLIAYFQISPLLFINTFGLSPAQYGWTSLMVACIYLAGGLTINLLVSRMGVYFLLLLGTLFLLSGGLLMFAAHWAHLTGLMAILVCSSIYILGARLVIPNAIAISMNRLCHLGGSSSALIGFIQMLGSSLISFGIASTNSVSDMTLAIIFTGSAMLILIIVLFMKPRGDMD